MVTISFFASCQSRAAPSVPGSMNKLNSEDAKRLRAAKRAIVDATIMVCAGFPVGNQEGRKVIAQLRAVHRRINLYLEQGRGDDLEPHPGIEPSQASYEEAPSP